MKLSIDNIKSPLQMIGFFLAWIETILAVSLWPIQDNEGLVTILLFSLVTIAVIVALSLVFSLIHLIKNYPQWLFNPADYDPEVQDELFDHDYSCSDGDKIKKLSLLNNKKAGDLSG